MHYQSTDIFIRVKETPSLQYLKMLHTDMRINSYLRIISTTMVFILLFCGGDAASQATELRKQFENELKALHIKYQFPGATAAFILPDGTTGAAAVGLADVENGIEMQPESRMLAASIGKTFIGATVLSLAGEGILSLDDSISTWFDDCTWFDRLPNHGLITLRHLLTHTSGIPNHVETESFALAFQEGKFSKDQPPSPEQLIAFILDRKALFKPGEGWAYSDTGYLLVGLIIEEVSGNSFYQEASRRFLRPLHLDLTSPSNRLEIAGLAAGYMSESNTFGLPAKTTIRPGVMTWHPGIEGAGGGFVSSPADLVVWGKTLYEGRAMECDYLDELLDSTPVSGDSGGVGYGIGVAVHSGGSFGPVYGHGGWIPGYSSSLRYYPKHRIAIAFQINTDIGIVDDSTPVIRGMETRLAQIIIQAENE